jgi:hypothetical protein
VRELMDEFDTLIVDAGPIELQVGKSGDTWIALLTGGVRDGDDHANQHHILETALSKQVHLSVSQFFAWSFAVVGALCIGWLVGEILFRYSFQKGRAQN